MIDMLLRRARPVAPAAIAAGLLLVACSGDDGPIGPSTGTADGIPPSAQVVAFDVVEEVTTPASGILDTRRLVITEEAAWQALWDELQGNVVPHPPVPEIDFTQRMAIVATLGTRPNGGYSVSVPEVARDGDVLYVVVEEGIPGAFCVTPDMIGTPAVALSVLRGPGEVRFVEREIAYPCASQ